jgi:hypothetical protein
VGNLLLVFHFSIRLRRRSCGNVGISPASGEISKGLVERGGSLPLAFHAFHSPGIPTALSLSGCGPVLAVSEQRDCAATAIALIDYATATLFAIGLFDTAFASEDNNIGIWR